jgi:hypothetical protein
MTEKSKKNVVPKGTVESPQEIFKNKKCECYATISKDDPRYEIWKQVNPLCQMPLKHPIPKNGFYEGDPTRLTSEQKEVMAKLLSEKFKLPPSEILSDLEKGIFPIKSDNLNIVICELHFRCMM